MLSKEEQSEFRNIQPVLMSNPAPVTGTAVQPVLYMVFTAGIRRSAKNNTWEGSTFLLTLYNDESTDVREIGNTDQTTGVLSFNSGATAISRLVSINSSGVISAIGDPDGDTGPAAERDAMLLLPVELTNKADPTVRNGANGNDMPIQFLQSSTDTNIGAVAWIAGNDPNGTPVDAPRMPHLQAQIGESNALAGVCIYWKLQVIFHDRKNNPHRDFDTGSVQNTAVPEDTVTIPIAASLSQNFQSSWHKVTDGTPWNIYDDPDWKEEVNDFGFFGGDATLSVIITSNDGSTTVVPQTSYQFRIAGENPDPKKCKTFISNVAGSFWYAYAIAKHETKYDGGRTYYNQFLDSGGKSKMGKKGKEGRPDWNNDGSTQNPVSGSGGYGLFQLTYAAGDPDFIMQRGWIWNWQSNVQQGLLDFSSKYSQAITYIDGQQSKTNTLIPKLSTPREANPDSGDEQNPHVYPSSQPATMYGGDARYGFPSTATASFYDDNDFSKPKNNGETFEAAEAIKLNNGLGGTGHYLQWNRSAWQFNRNRTTPPDNKSYVDLVTVEIESADSHAVAPK